MFCNAFARRSNVRQVTNLSFAQINAKAEWKKYRNDVPDVNMLIGEYAWSEGLEKNSIPEDSKSGKKKGSFSFFKPVQEPVEQVQTKPQESKSKELLVVRGLGQQLGLLLGGGAAAVKGGGAGA